MLGALIASAFAGPECAEVISRERFRTRVIDAQSALDRGELENTKGELDHMYDELPCLGFAPDPRLWADVMVVQAVANFALDEDWESPLAAALRIRPAIDRAVGRGHPIYDWPAPPELPKTELPPGTTLFVDGRKVAWSPGDQGWFLIQKTDGRNWETVLQRNAELSAAWVEAPVQQPPRIRYLLDLSVSVATLGREQRQSWEREEARDTFYDLAPQTGLTFGPRLQARATFYSNFGVAFNGTYMFGLAGGIRDGELLAITTPGVFVLGVGLGLYDAVREVDTQALDGQDQPIRVLDKSALRYWVASGSVRTRSPIQTEVAVTIGVRTLQTWLGTVDTRVVFKGKNSLGGHLRFGGRAAAWQSRYLAREDPSRYVQFSTLSLSMNAGMVFGDLR